MAVSTSYSFNLTTDQIITRALNLVGLGSIQTARSDEVAMAGDFLNVIVKAAQAKKAKPFLTTVERTTSALTAGQPVTCAADTIDVEDPIMLVPTAGGELRLDMIARDAYMVATDKTTQGRPLRVYVERGATCKLLFLPLPNGLEPTVRYTRHRLIRDMEAGTTADLPSRYLRYLIFALAHDLAMARNINPVQVGYLGSQADKEWESVKGDDRQPAPVRFVVRHRSSRW